MRGVVLNLSCSVCTKAAANPAKLSRNHIIKREREVCTHYVDFHCMSNSLDHHSQVTVPGLPELADSADLASGGFYNDEQTELKHHYHNSL